MKETDIKTIRTAFQATKQATYLGPAKENDESGFLCYNLRGFSRRIAYFTMEKIYNNLPKDLKELMLEILSADGLKAENLPNDPFLTELEITELDNLSIIFHTQFRFLSTLAIERTGTGACHEMTNDLICRLQQLAQPMLIAKNVKPDHKFVIIGVKYNDVTTDNVLDWEKLKKTDAIIGDPWLNNDILTTKEVNNPYYTGEYKLRPVEFAEIPAKEYEGYRTLYNQLYNKLFKIFSLHFIGCNEKTIAIEETINIPVEYKTIDLDQAFNFLQQRLQIANTFTVLELKEKTSKAINEKIELLVNKVSCELQDEFLKKSQPSAMTLLAFARTAWKTDKKRCAEICLRIHALTKDKPNKNFILKNLRPILNYLIKDTNLEESLVKKMTEILTPIPPLKDAQKNLLLANLPTKVTQLTVTENKESTLETLHHHS